jgi:hypothetical protein
VPTSFAASSAQGLAITGSFAGVTPTSLIALECSAPLCSWAGGSGGATPFIAGDSLIWTSDGANSGNGPLTLTLASSVSGAGALIQEDAPGSFEAEIQVFNGSSLLGSFSESSDAAGDPIYIGVKDTSGANINKVVFSIASTANAAGDISDFAIDLVLLNTSGGAVGGKLKISPNPGNFGKVKVGHLKTIKFRLKNTSRSGPSTTITGIVATNVNEFIIVNSKSTCQVGSVLSSSHPQCTLTVGFQPAATGIRPPGSPATITFQDNGSNAPQVLKMRGRGF